MLYALTRSVLKITKWLWPVVLIPLIIALIPLFVQVQTNNPLIHFLIPGLTRTITFIIFGILVFVPLAAWSILLTEGNSIRSKMLEQYLHAVEEANQGLNPKGFAQQSALISVNVPLENIFIHLNAISDRPLYDLPYNEEKMIEELRLGSNPNLSPEQREENIQRLHVLWHSQLGQDLLENQQTQSVTIAEVLRSLKAERPVAVLLGTPGSGKSTTLRWLALQMARASLSRSYNLPFGLSPRQIPILIHISDYAKRVDADNSSFKQFFIEHITKTYSELSNLSEKLLYELKKSHCLFLLDGLDEVASDSLRRRVAENIYTFICDHDTQAVNTQQFNRFIVTSRIVGYEAGSFNRYAHYTLLDLEDKQIELFLTNWCPAVERYQAMAVQGMKPLTQQQETQVTKASNDQRSRLLTALNENPGIKRLAVNPLMLTILALIQRSGRTLPHRRIDLYQIVTRTLLDNWNKDRGSRIFSLEEIPLAEQLLSDLAYRLHSSDPVLTEQDVKRIAAQVMDIFYQRPSGQTKEAVIQEFIETLRSSSGLFVESGQGLFSFMHRTFQEYYTALYLLRKPSRELKQFVTEHYNFAIWREPLLLAIAYKSTQGGIEERFQASELIEIIANSKDEYDEILQRSLLFAINCMIDCSPWSIHSLLQQQIAYRLFEIYGDSFGSGRFTQLQQDIEKAALLWLRGQPHGSNQHDTIPPMLVAWRNTLIDVNNPVRQEGAAKLLASIAPDLPTCPRQVLDTFLPVLLQLAGLQDLYSSHLSCSAEIRKQLFQSIAYPSPRVQEYALITLRLLEAAGPAGWLYADWYKWSQEQPELLERLSLHALELGYFITPAALPSKSDSSNWDTQSKLGTQWQQHAQHDPRGLQAQLLRFSDTARYPLAYVLKQMLEREISSASIFANHSWREVWDSYLKEEMTQGRYATYQLCLILRLLICGKDTQRRQNVANELVTTLSAHHRREEQTQALVTITKIFWLQMQDIQDEFGLYHLRELRYLQYLLELRDLIDLRITLYPLELRYLKDLRVLRSLRVLRDIRELLFLVDLAQLLNIQDLLNRDELVYNLCEMLEQQVNSLSAVLLCLFALIATHKSIPYKLIMQIQNSMNVSSRQFQQLTTEQSMLIEGIHRLINQSTMSTAPSVAPTSPPLDAPLQPPSFNTPDERASALYSIQQRHQLTKSEVQEILKVCNDFSRLSPEKQMKMNATTLRELAWKLITQPFIMKEDALLTLVEMLDNDNAVVCEAAALMLRNTQTFPQGVRKKATQKIMKILKDKKLSRQPLNAKDSGFWRLDDVLFDTLKVLEE